MPLTARKEDSQRSEKRLFISFLLNMLLSISQLAGGIVSGSLALIADALHNANDALTLLLSWWAKRYGRLAPDDTHSYGHQRIETIAALGNLISLGIFAVFIIEDAIRRWFAPVRDIDSMPVIVISIIAICVNVGTASLLFSGSRNNLNVRAAFLNNMVDAFSSIAVLIGGLLMMWYGWYWLDICLSLLIAGLMIFAMLREIKRVVNILMDAAPETVEPAKVVKAILKTKGVAKVVDFHIRRLNEDINAVEAHLVIADDMPSAEVKKDVKLMLYKQFNVPHVTLETSTRDELKVLKSVPHQHTLTEAENAKKSV